MSWKEMAPWIAIAITLIISIITPLITQIINNRFSLKIKNQEQIISSKKEKHQIACEFVEKVGACIAYCDANIIKEAGASINKMYLIMPENNWEHLDTLYSLIRKYKWDDAEELFKGLCRDASRLLNEEIKKEK